MNDAINLNDLRLFVRVVEHAGFAPAGRALGLPKSTLSKRVAALEEQLSARLLHRNARKLALTPLGEILFEHGRSMLLSAEAAEAAVAQRQAEPAGLVRLTCSTITARYYLAPLWPEFMRLYPRVSLAVHCSDRMVDIVGEGFDLALRDHLDPLQDSELVAIRVGHEPDFLAASQDWLEQYRAIKEPGDLIGADGLYCTGHGRTENWDLLDNAGNRRHVTLPLRFGSDDPGSVVEMAEAGLGVARLPRCICEPLFKEGRLVRVLADWMVPGPTTSLLFPHRRGQLPSTRAAIEFLTERLRLYLD